MNVVAVLDNLTEKTSKYDFTDKETFEFKFDPLLFVVGAQSDGFNNVSIYDLLSNISQYRPEFFEGVLQKSRRDQSKVDAIGRYFKNKILMRRLKGLYVSPYMVKLEEYLENPQKISASQLKIVIKLPDFYREGVETEDILSQHVSLPKQPAKTEHQQIKRPFRLTGAVERNAKNQRTVRYYFADEHNHLLEIEVLRGSKEHKFLKYLVGKKEAIGIDGYFHISHLKGYEDFFLYKDGEFDFYDPNS